MKFDAEEVKLEDDICKAIDFVRDLKSLELDKLLCCYLSKIHQEVAKERMEKYKDKYKIIWWDEDD